MNATLVKSGNHHKQQSDFIMSDGNKGIIQKKKICSNLIFGHILTPKHKNSRLKFFSNADK